MKKIAILGSTGSIGRNALEVIALHPDRFGVTALAAGENVELLAEQIARFRPRLVSVKTRELAEKLAAQVREEPPEIAWGTNGMVRVATAEGVDVVVSAVVGAAGLIPTLAAIDAGRDIALANKETLVMAGDLVIDRVRQKGVSLIPVDSEHSAVFQCMNAGSSSEVRRVILTASGGPFLDMDPSEFDGITVEQALAHPNWSMGPKITIDSATMMNKGLEVIEARHLFDLPPDRIDVVIHPQSIVHSMVEFEDGSVIAQMGVPDMKIPIAYALSHPERLDSGADRLDLVSVGALEFREVDRERFPALEMAYRALEVGGDRTAVLNAANEVAVAAFLDGLIKFTDIARIIGEVLGELEPAAATDVEQILDADRRSRAAARTIIEDLQ